MMRCFSKAVLTLTLAISLATTSTTVVASAAINLHQAQAQTKNESKPSSSVSLSKRQQMNAAGIIERVIELDELGEDAPIQIACDEMTYDDQKKMSIYEGNVILKRGKLEIKADKLTVYTGADNSLERIVATGNRAFYKDQPKPNEPEISAYGRMIKYFADTSKLILIREAEINHGNFQFSSEIIDYNLSKTTGATTEKKSQQISRVSKDT